MEVRTSKQTKKERMEISRVLLITNLDEKL